MLPVDRRLTTAAYLEDWLEHDAKPRIRPNTYRLDRWLTDQHIAPQIGRVPLAKLQPEHIQALLSADQGLGPDSLRLVLTVLRSALRRAERNGHIRRNVATLVDAPRGQKRRVDPYTAEQAATLLRAARGHEDGAIVITAIAIGARLGEVLALRWQDVDLDAGTLSISHTLIEHSLTLAPAKTESSRRDRVLPAFAVEALRDHRREQVRRRLAADSEWEDQNLVFCDDRGRPVRASCLRTRYYLLLEDAGLPGSVSTTSGTRTPASTSKQGRSWSTSARRWAIPA